MQFSVLKLWADIVVVLVFGIALNFLISIKYVLAQPDLPDLGSDGSVLEDPNSSSFSDSNIFFEDTNLNSDATVDTTATSATDATADTTATTATTSTSATTVSVADSSTGADTAIVFSLAGGLSLVTLLIINKMARL
ncbi:hypothetical protein CO101_03595 [Candidatus Berkelbacteria bacterium CG_4_9_14_3_um_filter_39_23]|uniref:Uncharacterized protein n=1 Tax=Candidatus Berkelbacteria bacterium CG_4_9_14_3_um_filter_39_23 TaxID=1974508 RepID=A0A2M8C449_9BACT|nr:MAG: hypothetical protein AUK14_01920 [Candidatus Berkelbacteria bacterium CG2_30_39_44]PIR27659.1 MAG: hypothetical protein COV39_03310 [Candidatus Berkelbacteria bacterium CG11_big_fil_rev_8_21_14_0_20_40_23]PIX30763.1 MAG: hypothetical protein COZ62_00910 [Candidatus Berkelbacteria bacterium CG_4_8_14_3_um_filter_39_27]PIZ28945.1 MAG: hypothetical protein COY44_01470 [Candidatus Berkelbacteria bacterium CG_4_10_14_0_8_um_filter_39_42]PJB50851.1 MAG: hypothetical protein CO101_03595 [Candi